MKSFWVICTAVFGLSSLGGYAWWIASGREYGAPRARVVPAEVRASPGGYRSFHFWHVGFGGYRGGK